MDSLEQYRRGTWKVECLMGRLEDEQSLMNSWVVYPMEELEDDWFLSRLAWVSWFPKSNWAGSLMEELEDG